MEDQKESFFEGNSNLIAYECTQKIIEQMEKNICKIKIGEEQGTGFFCKIPFPDKNNMLPVFITNNKVLGEELLYKKDAIISINIKTEKDIKEINLNNRMKYTNNDYDITIIEIKEKDKIKNYLELDDNIINRIINNENNKNKYIDKTIYILQYPEGNLSVSYGILDKINEDKKYIFNHNCCTKIGSSGSPVLGVNNKLIGIHKEGIYNKAIFLDYPIKEFIKINYDINNKIEIINIQNNNLNEIFLNEFNKKYNLNIRDDKINKLELKMKRIGNEGLNDLSKIKFEELKELYLDRNNISDINKLENARFNKLEILSLNSNKISDINILEKVNFNKLKVLNLNCNNISNIKVFENVAFNNLEKLYLENNEISDINVLDKVNFKELKELDLGSNNISDIKILEKVDFNKLEILSLNNNKISEISILEKVNFKEMKKLYLYRNNISDIKVLENVKFDKLEILSLSSNKISDINILEKVNFRELKDLYLNGNNISDINVLAKFHFNKLEQLNLYHNKIYNINILENIDFNILKVLNLDDNCVDITKNKILIAKLKSKIKEFSI